MIENLPKVRAPQFSFEVKLVAKLPPAPMCMATEHRFEVLADSQQEYAEIISKIVADSPEFYVHAPSWPIQSMGA